MQVASQDTTMYEAFDPIADTLYFKIGHHGLISFHGRNYNIKKRLSADERNNILSNSATFFPITSTCYVNVQKISNIGDEHIYFGDSSKTISCSSRKQQRIRAMLAH